MSPEYAAAPRRTRLSKHAPGTALHSCPCSCHGGTQPAAPLLHSAAQRCPCSCHGGTPARPSHTHPLQLVTPRSPPMPADDASLARQRAAIDGLMAGLSQAEAARTGHDSADAVSVAARYPSTDRLQVRRLLARRRALPSALERAFAELSEVRTSRRRRVRRRAALTPSFAVGRNGGRRVQHQGYGAQP